MSSTRISSIVTTTMLLIFTSIAWYQPGCAEEPFPIALTNAITVDGRMLDWPGTSTTLLTEQKVVVGLGRDSANLFVLVRFTNKDYARAIRMGGLTVWLDPRGKKNKDFRATFTGGPADMIEDSASIVRDESREREESNVDGSPFGQTRPPGRMENRLSIYHKDVTDETVVRLDGSEGPSAACGIDKGFYVYEFRIPFQGVQEHAYGLKIDPSRPLGVGLVWGDLGGAPRGGGRRPGGEGGDPRGGDMDKGGGGMPPGSMGGPPMGGPGGPGGPGGAKSNVPSKQEIWLKAKVTHDTDTGKAANGN